MKYNADYKAKNPNQIHWKIKNLLFKARVESNRGAPNLFSLRMGSEILSLSRKLEKARWYQRLGIRTSNLLVRCNQTWNSFIQARFPCRIQRSNASMGGSEGVHG